MKTKLDKNSTIGDLVVRYPHLRQSLEMLGLDYCCGGAKMLSDACGDVGLLWQEVEVTLNAALEKQPNENGRDWNTAPLNELRRLYSAVRGELEPHLMKEEQILFPLIKETEAFVKDDGKKPVSHCGSVANPIGQMEVEHDAAGNELAEMRRLTNGYKLPTGACQTFAALYEGLAAMEDDLHEHIHLENNILFPKSIAQEATMQDS